MARATLERNPFQPGAGARPPLLAGRDPERALAKGKLALLETGRRPSRGVLFVGPRGNGKTSLLDDIADDARERRIRAEDLSVSSFDNRELLIGRLGEKARVTGNPLQQVQFAGAGVGVQPGPPPGDAADLLAHWIAADKAPLVILLDEVQAVPAVAGRMFFGAVQAATRQELPFLLLAAGTPDAPRSLREAGTFTERMFRQVPVGRLQREATVRALARPAAEAGMPLTDAAAAHLAEESQDYPTFIQILGRAAWEAAVRAEAPEIRLESARAASASVRPELERFHSARLQEARSRGVHRALPTLAAFLARHGGRLAEADLDQFLGEASGASGASGEADLLAALTDLGVLWETPAGWEMGIPSFGDFLLRTFKIRKS